MGKTRAVFPLAIFVPLILAIPALAQHEHGAGEPEKLGKVEFAISCDPALQPQFNRAVALLHSFWYKKAAETFAGIARQDLSCGMAQWGVAMTHYHQLWEAPSAEDLKQGWAAVENAKTAGAKTARERDYITAIETFYKNFDKQNHRTRALAYEKAMEQLQARYPEDREAAIFYALAVRADAPPGDKTYANQKKAGAILEKIFAQQPEHPGLAHYIIHCDDYAPLAAQALDAARRYAKIAPDSPHALHMPSHIFTRLGLWQESIESNLASAAAARKDNAAGDELHARDYLVYAYLQRGALSLPSRTFPGGRYLYAELNLDFARALGAARMSDAGAAKSALLQLTSVRDTLAKAEDKYWAEQADIQREVVAAWIALAEGKQDDALRQMRAAADHEDTTDKHPVTPGAIAPARELLGEMLLGAKQPGPALEAFEATLRVAPERFNALAGAARAAEEAGNREKASAYYAKLLRNCDQADGDRPELRDAKVFLAQK